MNKILTTATFLLMLIAVVLLIYIIVFKINSEGVQCTFDPLVYGATKLQEQNEYPLQCQCNLLSDNPAPTLYFNSNGSWFETIKSNPGNWDVPSEEEIKNWLYGNGSK